MRRCSLQIVCRNSRIRSFQVCSTSIPIHSHLELDPAPNAGKLRRALPSRNSLPYRTMSTTEDSHSTTPTPAESHSDSSSLEEVWRQTTQRILDYKRGEFPASAWAEAESTIYFWLGQSTMDGIRMPLKILDRLLDEEQTYHIDPSPEAQHISTEGTTPTTTTNAKATAIPNYFQTDLLNLILNHWRLLVFEDPVIRQQPEFHPQMIVQRLMNYHHVPTTTLQPNTQTFAMVVDACASYDDGPKVATSLVGWTIEQGFQCPWLQPNVYTFSSLMHTWVKSKQVDAPEEVERILEQMFHLHLEHGWDVAPNQVTYSTAIDAWAKHGRVDRVEQLLQDMHTAYKDVGLQQLRPNLPAFNGLLVALARAGEMDRAESMLQQMEDLYDAGELEEPPGVISYSTVLDAFAKSKERGSASRAETILRQMKNRGIEANVISWNSVIDAYSKEKNPERAEALLNEMNDEYLKGNHSFKPTMRTYSVVLAGWSDTRSPKSGERAESLLHHMKNLADADELEPLDVVVYNSVLACWAKSSFKGAALRAKDFLEKTMIARDGMKPDTYSYNTVMSALVRVGHIREAESMLDSMPENGVQPDITTYNTILYAWVNSDARNAAARVKELYNTMKEDPQVDGDLITNNTLMHFYSKSGNANAAENLLSDMCSPDSKIDPDSISFNTAIGAWNSSNASDAPERAEAILDRMMKMDSGRKVQPNVRTFNSLLNIWVKHRPTAALPECKRLISVMLDLVSKGNTSVQPDAFTYNILIHAHGVSQDDNAMPQADLIFQEMYRRFKDGEGRLKPTEHTYGSLVHGWSKCTHPDAALKAEEGLRWWIERANSGEVDGRPKVYSFVAAMKAHATSGNPQAAYKVDALLHLLMQEYKNGNEEARPNNNVFTTILQVLEKSPIPNKSEPAGRIIHLMKQYNVKPDQAKIELLKKCCSS